MKTEKPLTPPHPLVGRFFHSFEGEPRVVVWQGQILATAETGVLVQLYEWFVGEPSAQKWCPWAAVEQWELYVSIEQMNDAYEHKHRFRRPVNSTPDPLPRVPQPRENVRKNRPD